MNIVRKKGVKIVASVIDHYHKKYITYDQAILNWYKSKDLNYQCYRLFEMSRFKKSDTIFVLGSGPSLNELNEDHINIIKQHDSFGINYSFLKKELVPTFHQNSWEGTFGLKYFAECFADFKDIYTDVVIFVHSKQLFRLAHPRLMPNLFPINAKCCFYNLPEPIILECSRPFNDRDFAKSLFYRGSLSLVLDLIVKLEYKNIVLLGIDLDKWAHFYDDMEVMKEYTKKLYDLSYGVGVDKKKFVYMYTKPGKNQPFDEYLYALNYYLESEKGIKLFIGLKDNMLYPRIPAYFE